MRSYYSFGFGGDVAASPWECLSTALVKAGSSGALVAEAAGMSEAALGKIVNAYGVLGIEGLYKAFATEYNVAIEGVRKDAGANALAATFKKLLAEHGCSTTGEVAPPAPPTQLPAPVPGIMLDAGTVAQLRAQAERVSAPGGAFAQIRALAPQTKALAQQQAAAAVQQQAAAGGVGKALPIIAVGALAALLLLK